MYTPMNTNIYKLNTPNPQIQSTSIWPVPNNSDLSTCLHEIPFFPSLHGLIQDNPD